MMVKVRFAPSPTGYLHVGNTRTAIINYLFSRKSKGQLVLRIEDTDVERSDAMYEESIMQDLKWLGLAWDEGPYRQSERFEIYSSYAEILLEKGLAYKCFCSKETLEKMRQACLERGEPPRYPGTCRQLPRRTIEMFEAEGKPYVVRFKATRKSISFRDEIHGKIEFPLDHVDDFILLKQELTPSYNFAATVDDMLMGITHVIRGGDHVSNTPKQMMLFDSFGAQPPRYAHHSLVVGHDRKPLSKRQGATSIREFRDMGILRSAIMNYIGILGRSIKKELMEEQELIDTFTLTSLSSSDAVFDMEKLLWLNKEHIRGSSVDRLLGTLYLPNDFTKKVALIKENAKTLNEIRELLGMFDSADTTDEGLAYLSEVEAVGSIISTLKKSLMDQPDTDFDSIAQTVKGESNLVKKELFMVLRILITGRRTGPPLKELFQFIPKEIIMKRLNAYLTTCRQA